MLTVSLRPVPTASIFFVLDLISSDLAARNLEIKSLIPFSGVGELFDFVPLVLDFVDVLLAFVEFSFERVDDFGDLVFDLLEVLIMVGVPWVYFLWNSRSWVENCWL